MLAKDFRFQEADFRKIEAGEAVARMADTGRADDVRMSGVVLIKVSAEDYIKAFRDIEHFQFSKDVTRTGRFSTPAVDSDLAGFEFPDLRQAELLACKPGHCAYKIPAAEMSVLQSSIDWNAPGARVEAVRVIRQRIAAYVNRYRQQGDPALAIYYDSPEPYSVAEGLRSLLGSETQIAAAFPALIHYASAYPAGRPSGAEDFYYWQEAAFGLRRVLRAQHVMLQKLPVAGDAQYFIISKMLFATHYFRAAIEYSYVYPVRTAAGEPAIFLATAQRSFVDGMSGFRGAIVRRIAESRSPAKLVENLELAKQVLERR